MEITNEVIVAFVSALLKLKEDPEFRKLIEETAESIERKADPTVSERVVNDER